MDNGRVWGISHAGKWSHRLAVLGIAPDKMRLLRGEFTGITEQKIANHRWADEELQKLMREFQCDRATAMEIGE